MRWFLAFCFVAGFWSGHVFAESKPSSCYLALRSYQDEILVFEIGPVSNRLLKLKRTDRWDDQIRLLRANWNYIWSKLVPEEGGDSKKFKAQKETVLLEVAQVPARFLRQEEIWNIDTNEKYKRIFMVLPYVSFTTLKEEKNEEGRDQVTFVHTSLTSDEEEAVFHHLKINSAEARSEKTRFPIFQTQPKEEVELEIPLPPMGPTYD